MRGRLTAEVNDVAEAHLGREITTEELRLMVYAQYVMVNDQRIDPNRVNQKEREILKLWREESNIEGGAAGMRISKHFWDAINEIVWIAYVCAQGGDL